MARKGNIQKFQETHILENGGLLKFVCAKESASPKWVGKVVYPSFLYGLMQKRFGNEVKQRQKQPESIVTLPASSNPAYRYHTFPLPMHFSISNFLQFPAQLSSSSLPIYCLCVYSSLTANMGTVPLSCDH